MFTKVSPESVGISSKKVLNFIKTLEDYNFSTHNIIMAKGDKIFTECYYAPFNKDFKHRMYSISKSFVSIAVGFAIEDGLLSLDDKFVKFFPEYINENTDEEMKEMTIKDMLVMETCKFENIHWFYSGTDDRREVYFRRGSGKVAGTIFDYDSPASFMLCAIVENLTKKPFLEYLQEKFLNDIGFSKDAYCIKTPGGVSFGDSGVMCTAMDLLLFARFVMNKGTFDGIRYMNEDYLNEATKKQVCNNNTGLVTHGGYGYGYQIWKTPNDGFAFIGMGDQFAICDIETDFIFVINSDNQGSTYSRPILYHELYNNIINSFGEKLDENENDLNELNDHIKNCKLLYLKGDKDSNFKNELNGTTYKLMENPMNIEYMKFDFEGEKGKITYKNLQGEKEIYFGFGHNEFFKFPEEGYSDLIATYKEENHKYDCAASADWTEEKKLRIKIQIIDKYFGNMCIVCGFKNDKMSVVMTKTAEAFLDEYKGRAIGYKM